jgi:hypothetical protein
LTRAARRHGALKAEHDAIKLHVAGRDLDRLRSRLADSVRQQHTWRAEERSLVASLADADARLLAVEAELTAAGGRDVGDAEIADAWHAIVIEQDVGRLEIAMEDAVVVGVLHRERYIA